MGVNALIFRYLMFSINYNFLYICEKEIMSDEKLDGRTLGDFLKDLNIKDSIDFGLEHLNEDESVKKKLASCIEDDIQQYLPDIGETWGDEVVTVKIKDDDAFVVWRDHWMPTIDFYQLVFKNSGIVEPKDFESYENLL